MCFFEIRKMTFLQIRECPIFKRRNKSLINTKILQFSNTKKNISFSNTKNVLFSNTKSKSVSNAKTSHFQIRKMWSECIFKYECYLFSQQTARYMDQLKWDNVLFRCRHGEVVFRFEFCRMDQNHLNMSLKEMIFQRTPNKRISSAFREFS